MDAKAIMINALDNGQKKVEELKKFFQDSQSEVYKNGSKLFCAIHATDIEDFNKIVGTSIEIAGTTIKNKGTDSFIFMNLGEIIKNFYEEN